MPLHPISLADGSLGPPTKAESKPAPRWKEADFQHVLLLNPELLGVADQLPLDIDGSSTAVRVDQSFIDDVGRLTIVELKAKRAGLDALAQALSYAMHWQPPPMGEVVSGYRQILRHGTVEEVLAHALDELRSWASKARNPTRVTKRPCPWTKWKSPPSPRELAEHYYGRDGLLLLGAPPRVLLVAPQFDDEVITMAESLAARWVSVELVKAALHRDDSGALYLSWNRVDTGVPADIETTWRAARLLWRELPELRTRYRLNGYADQFNTWAFSFSPLAAPRVRVFLETDASSVVIETTVPDKLLPQKSDSKRLKSALVEATGGRAVGRMISAKVPSNDQARIVATMRRYIAAVDTLLVPVAREP